MRIVANGIAIEIDDQGLPSGEPLLLIMGLGMQIVGWPDELVQLLVARGFRVIRMDNRDIGLSQHFDHLGVPNLPWAALRYALHLPVHPRYSLVDMAADAVGVLDALGLPRAHVCGASMGGMVAQHLAARHPDRVKSLTLMMTTSGARHLPQPSLPVRRVLMSRPHGNDVETVVKYLVRLLGVIGSPGFPPDSAYLQRRLRAMVMRSWHPAGTARQLVAVVADGDRTHMLARIAAPTHIVHGEQDALVPVAAGHDLSRKITGSTHDIVAGMGHDLPLPLLPHYAQGITANAERAG